MRQPIIFLSALPLAALLLSVPDGTNCLSTRPDGQPSADNLGGEGHFRVYGGNWQETKTG